MGCRLALSQGCLGRRSKLNLGKLIASGATRGRVSEALRAGGMEAATEAVQSGQESYSQQKAVKERAGGPNVKVADIFNEVVGGALAGGVMGGTIGLAAGSEGVQEKQPKKKAEQPEKKVPKNQGGATEPPEYDPFAEVRQTDFFYNQVGPGKTGDLVSTGTTGAWWSNRGNCGSGRWQTWKSRQKIRQSPTSSTQLRCIP
jgi:hypothetical protein